MEDAYVRCTVQCSSPSPWALVRVKRCWVCAPPSLHLLSPLWLGGRLEGLYFKKGYSEGLRRCKVFSLQLQRMVVMLWASELGKASTNNTASWWK